jgi:pyruvate/2-oxoglutarate dehydrogenase complex dihydrolipoamide acyltransferase (E2) component
MEVQVSKRFIAMLAGALAIVVLVAGCGGGSDSGDGSTASADNNTAQADSGDGASSNAPALSKAEFIKQGDEICSNAAKSFAEGVVKFMSENGIDESEGPSEEQEEELITEVILPAYQTQAEELGELGPPKGEEDAVAEIVTGFEEVVADGEGDPSSVVGGDDPFADAKSKAREFGLQVCGA